MKNLVYAITAFSVMSLFLVIVPSVIAGSNDAPVAQVGDILKIITTDDQARLCPNPLCKKDQELFRVPTNTELKIEEVSLERLPMWDIVWYKIAFNGKKGWISEFDTDKAPKEPRKRQ